MDGIEREIENIVIGEIGRNTLSPRTIGILGKTI